jgi:hypothetical protein
VEIITDTLLSTLDDETGDWTVIEAHKDTVTESKEIVLFPALVPCVLGHYHPLALYISILY